MKTSFFALTAVLLVACSGSSSSVPDPGNGDDVSKTDPSSSSKEDPTDPGTKTDDPKKNDPDPVPSTGPVATSADCASFAAKFCTKATACNHLVARMLGTACEDRVANICAAHLSSPGTGFTQTALTSCANAYTTMTCAEAFGNVQPAACMFTGTLALNAECAFDDQCASGSCSATETSCGMCEPNTKPPPTTTPMADLGEACDNSGKTAPQCNYAFGLWCNTSTNKCEAIPTVAEGQPCGYTGESLVLCDAGSQCKTGTTGQGTCIAEIPVGGACTPGGASCAFGTSCLGGKCAYPTAAAICK